MKVFISWSGERSKQVAELINEWLQCTIQSVQPWLSTRGIDRGELWFTAINNELSQTSIGVICLTQENKDKPWILFETGALAKGLSSNRVCTFLIDLKPLDLENPLAQFNHTEPNRESMLSLLQTINSLSVNNLQPSILEKVFAKYWDEFIDKFDAIIAATPSDKKPVKRDKDDILYEILNTVRDYDKRIRNLEVEKIELNNGLINISTKKENVGSQDIIKDKIFYKKVVQNGETRFLKINFDGRSEGNRNNKADLI